jgi:hypothetical protein
MGVMLNVQTLAVERIFTVKAGTGAHVNYVLKISEEGNVNVFTSTSDGESETGFTVTYRKIGNIIG